MSLHPTLFDPIPPDTAAVARAVFAQGNTCPRLRDRLGSIFADEQFASLFPKTAQPAECPWRLALATLLQFSENLSDRRAADAVRSRIDWKDLLGLRLSDTGFDASVLFDRLLAVCREQGFLAEHGPQRTDSTHVLRAVRALNRLGCAIETLRAAPTTFMFRRAKPPPLATPSRFASRGPWPASPAAPSPKRSAEGATGSIMRSMME